MPEYTWPDAEHCKSASASRELICCEGFRGRRNTLTMSIVRYAFYGKVLARPMRMLKS